MKTIFLVIPRRISVRYVLATDVFSYLKKFDHRIIILTSISDPLFIKEFENERVKIEVIEMRDYKEGLGERLVRMTRNYLGGAGYDLETLNAKAKMRGLVVWLFYRLFRLLLRPFLFLRSWLRWLDIYWLSSLIDKKYEPLFEKYNPDLLVIHSVQELTAVPVARVAQRKNVPSLGIVTSWDNLTNKVEIYARCQKLIVWNPVMKNQAVQYHDYQDKDIFVVGTPQFDF